MKYLYLGILILAFLLCLCFCAGRQIDARARAVMEPLGRAMAAEAAGNDLLRDRSVAEAARLWEEGAALFACLLSHSHTEAVTLELRELPLLTGTEFHRSCVRLVARLQAIREMDRPRLGNVF